ncbi:GyrI-like domain-containing protein [Nocardioides acrostichi]|uniref:GyrI-like domain-containing protein n=1 Tax=Nocardioides acrostichi TaxID=2784339 RepID=UPI001F2F3E1E|nr:GyrI-like domain-containing protein [Nocardioides acrostichi]
MPEIKAILSTDDADRRADLVAGHLSRLEGELDRTRAAVVALQRLLRPDAEALAIELRLVPERTVAAVSGTVRRDDVNAWYDAAMRDLDAAVAPGDRLGTPAGRYANELFTEGSGEVMVFYPVQEIVTTGRVETVSLPEIELAVAVHSGSHDDITETYGRLGQWVVDHALVVAGPVHETYLVGPRDNDAETTWRTEIGWPIFRISRR